jgi:hypothetical protein
MEEAIAVGYDAKERSVEEVRSRMFKWMRIAIDKGLHHEVRFVHKGSRMKSTH